MTLDPVVLIAIVATLGLLYLLAKKMGWALPPWAYAVAGAGVALLGLFRGRKSPVAPTPPVSPEPVRKAAADVLTERAAQEQKKIETALKSDAPEQDLADLTNARKR